MVGSVPTFKYGYVVGRFINSKGDSKDFDRFPDYIGSKIKPTFTRVQGQYVQPLNKPEFGIYGAMVYHEPVVAGVTDQGFLTGDVDTSGRPLDYAKPGIWLVVGRYRVNLGSQFPSMEIEVLESHTEDAPLDLSTEQKYSPPPGVIVNTLPLPTGGEPGQVYGWTGSSVGWYTPEKGLSAYEVALRNGFSGTVDDWLSSLKGVKGDPGMSAYEVALSRGFSGTVDEWLASLPGSESVDLSSYYTKSEVDQKVSGIPEFDSTKYYTKGESDSRLSAAVTAITSPDLSNYYTREEVDDKLASAPTTQGGMLAAYLAALD